MHGRRQAMAARVREAIAAVVHGAHAGMLVLQEQRGGRRERGAAVGAADVQRNRGPAGGQRVRDRRRERVQQHGKQCQPHEAQALCHRTDRQDRHVPIIAASARRGARAACGKLSSRSALGQQDLALDLHGALAVGQPHLAVLDRALQLHRTLGHLFQLGAGFCRDVDDGDFLRAFELAGEALEPDVAGGAVAVHDHVCGTAGRLHEAAFVGLADLDPEVDGPRQVLEPQGGLFDVEQVLAVGERRVGVQGEGEQADHHALVGFRRMPRDGERVLLVVVAVHVRNVQVCLVNRRFQCHSISGLRSTCRALHCRSAMPAVHPYGCASRPALPPLATVSLALSKKGSAEHDGLVAVQQDTVFHEPLDRAGQHDALDVAPDGRQLLHAHGVVDALDVLLDDRAFVQVARDEVGRRADQLDAAAVRLRVRTGALEAGQERMVDVDRPALQGLAQPRRQDLHVARQHDQVDAVGVQQLDDARLLGELGRFAGTGLERQVVEWDIVTGRELVEVHVVRHDRRNLHRQQAAAVAEQQVVQAMADLGHHDQHARFAPGVVQCTVRPQVLAQRAEAGAQQFVGHRVVFQREVHAHEEQLRFRIAELGRVDDVAAVFGQKARDAQHDTAVVQAGQGDADDNEPPIPPRRPPRRYAEGCRLAADRRTPASATGRRGARARAVPVARSGHARLDERRQILHPARRHRRGDARGRGRHRRGVELAPRGRRRSSVRHLRRAAVLDGTRRRESGRGHEDRSGPRPAAGVAERAGHARHDGLFRPDRHRPAAGRRDGRGVGGGGCGRRDGGPGREAARMPRRRHCRWPGQMPLRRRGARVRRLHRLQGRPGGRGAEGTLPARRGRLFRQRGRRHPRCRAGPHQHEGAHRDLRGDLAIQQHDAGARPGQLPGAAGEPGAHGGHGGVRLRGPLSGRRAAPRRLAAGGGDQEPRTRGRRPGQVPRRPHDAVRREELREAGAEGDRYGDKQGWRQQGCRRRRRQRAEKPAGQARFRCDGPEPAASNRQQGWPGSPPEGDGARIRLGRSAPGGPERRGSGQPQPRPHGRHRPQGRGKPAIRQPRRRGRKIGHPRGQPGGRPPRQPPGRQGAMTSPSAQAPTAPPCRARSSIAGRCTRNMAVLQFHPYVLPLPPEIPGRLSGAHPVPGRAPHRRQPPGRPPAPALSRRPRRPHRQGVVRLRAGPAHGDFARAGRPPEGQARDPHRHRVPRRAARVPAHDRRARTGAPEGKGPRQGVLQTVLLNGAGLPPGRIRRAPVSHAAGPRRRAAVGLMAGFTALPRCPIRVESALPALHACPSDETHAATPPRPIPVSCTVRTCPGRHRPRPGQVRLAHVRLRHGGHRARQRTRSGLHVVRLQVQRRRRHAPLEHRRRQPPRRPDRRRARAPLVGRAAGRQRTGAGQHVPAARGMGQHQVPGDAGTGAARGPHRAAHLPDGRLPQGRLCVSVGAPARRRLQRAARHEQRRHRRHAALGPRPRAQCGAGVLRPQCRVADRPAARLRPARHRHLEHERLGRAQRPGQRPQCRDLERHRRRPVRRLRRVRPGRTRPHAALRDGPQAHDAREYRRELRPGHVVRDGRSGPHGQPFVPRVDQERLRQRRLALAGAHAVRDVCARARHRRDEGPRPARGPAAAHAGAHGRRPRRRTELPAVDDAAADVAGGWRALGPAHEHGTQAAHGDAQVSPLPRHGAAAGRAGRRAGRRGRPRRDRLRTQSRRRAARRPGGRDLPRPVRALPRRRRGGAVRPAPGRADARRVLHARDEQDAGAAEGTLVEDGVHGPRPAAVGTAGQRGHTPQGGGRSRSHRLHRTHDDAVPRRPATAPPPLARARPRDPRRAAAVRAAAAAGHLGRDVPLHRDRAARGRRRGARRGTRAARHVRSPGRAQPERHRPDAEGHQVLGRTERHRRRAADVARRTAAAARPRVPGQRGGPRRPHRRQPSVDARAGRVARPLLHRARERHRPRRVREPDRRRHGSVRAAPALHAPHRGRLRPLRRRRHRRSRPRVLHQLVRAFARGRSRPAGARRQRRRRARAAHRRQGVVGPGDPARRHPGRSDASAPVGAGRHRALRWRAPPGGLSADGRRRPGRPRTDGAIRPALRHLPRGRDGRQLAADRRRRADQRLVVAGRQGAPARTARAADLCGRVGSEPGRVLRAAQRVRNGRRHRRLRGGRLEQPRRTVHGHRQRRAARPAAGARAALLPHQRHVGTPPPGRAGTARHRSGMAGHVRPRRGPLAAAPDRARRRRRRGDGARHHGAQAGRGPHPPHGPPRRADRPAQPQPDPRPPRPGRAQRPAQRRPTRPRLRRPGRLQARQRRPRSQRGRRTAEGRRLPHAGLPAPHGHAGAPGRRRIRDPAARRRRKPAGPHAGAGKDSPGRDGARADRRPVGARELQHGRRRVPARRRRSEDPHDECRCRDVPRQGPRQQQLPVLHARDERERRGKARAAGRPAPGAGRHAGGRRARRRRRRTARGGIVRRPLPPAVPAEGRPAHGPPVRRGSAGPLAPSGTRPRAADALHRPRGRIGPDRRPGRMGRAHRVPPGAVVARRGAGSAHGVRQRVGPPVRGKAPRRTHRRRAARQRPAAVRARPGGDGKPADARPESGRRAHGRTEGDGRDAVDRRLRHRLFEPVGAEVVPHLDAEDRQVVRARPRVQLGRPGHRAGRDLAGPPHAPARDRRGRGDRRAARLPARARLRRDAGLPVQPSGPGGTHHRDGAGAAAPAPRRRATGLVTHDLPSPSHPHAVRRRPQAASHAAVLGRHRRHVHDRHRRAVRPGRAGGTAGRARHLPVRRGGRRVVLSAGARRRPHRPRADRPRGPAGHLQHQLPRLGLCDCRSAARRDAGGAARDRRVLHLRAASAPDPGADRVQPGRRGRQHVVARGARSAALRAGGGSRQLHLRGGRVARGHAADRRDEQAARAAEVAEGRAAGGARHDPHARHHRRADQADEPAPHERAAGAGRTAPRRRRRPDVHRRAGHRLLQAHQRPPGPRGRRRRAARLRARGARRTARRRRAGALGRRGIPADAAEHGRGRRPHGAGTDARPRGRAGTVRRRRPARQLLGRPVRLASRRDHHRRRQPRRPGAVRGQGGGPQPRRDGLGGRRGPAQAPDQRIRIGVAHQQLRVRRPHEAGADEVVDERREAVVEPARVEEADGLGVDAQLGPRDHLEQFFQRAHPARHGDEAFGQVRHHRLPFVHVLHDEQAREAGVAHFALDEVLRDHARRVAAEAQHFIRDHAHQAHLAAAVDEADVVLDEGAGQAARGVGVDGIGAQRGAAVDGDGFHVVLRSIRAAASRGSRRTGAGTARASRRAGTGPASTAPGSSRARARPRWPAARCTCAGCARIRTTASTWRRRPCSSPSRRSARRPLPATLRCAGLRTAGARP
ncbi:hypothetical protein Lal_00014799 [Lupinus albus]|nr:hypothetical protein Lal_00014799 [Lupinus albus]